MYENGSADPKAFIASAETVPGPATDTLEQVSRELGVFVCVGMLELEGGVRYNTQVVIDPSRGCLGGYRKVQASTFEQLFVKPGNDFPVFDINGIPTGILICRDKSHPEVARILALEGAQLLLAPHSTTDRPNQQFTSWSLKICAVRAMENGCYVIANNNIYESPMEGDRTQAGFNFAVDPYGSVIHCDEGDSGEEKMALVTVDSGKVEERREWEGSGFNLWTRRPEAYGRLIQDPAGPRD